MKLYTGASKSGGWGARAPAPRPGSASEILLRSHSRGSPNSMMHWQIQVEYKYTVFRKKWSNSRLAALGVDPPQGNPGSPLHPIHYLIGQCSTTTHPFPDKTDTNPPHPNSLAPPVVLFLDPTHWTGWPAPHPWMIDRLRSRLCVSPEKLAMKEVCSLLGQGNESRVPPTGRFSCQIIKSEDFVQIKLIQGLNWVFSVKFDCGLFCGVWQWSFSVGFWHGAFLLDFSVAVLLGFFCGVNCGLFSAVWMWALSMDFFFCTKFSVAIFTARIRRMGEGKFQFVCSHLGYPCPRFFPRSLVPGPFPGGPQSQVLSQVTDPRSFPGGITLLARTVPYPGISGGPEGVQGTCAPLWANFFHFHAVFMKNWSNSMSASPPPPWGWRTPLGNPGSANGNQRYNMLVNSLGCFERLNIIRWGKLFSKWMIFDCSIDLLKFNNKVTGWQNVSERKCQGNTRKIQEIYFNKMFVARSRQMYKMGYLQKSITKLHMLNKRKCSTNILILPSWTEYNRILYKY